MRRPPHPTGQADDGFTLVEAMVSITIIALIFSALAFSALSALKAGVVARQNQQASDLADRQVEDIRSRDYAGVSNVTSDVSGDLCPASGPDNGCVRVSGSYLEHRVNGTWERLVSNTTGSVPTHAATVNAQGASYQVKTFITAPAATLVSGSAQYKRIDVVVSWTQYGASHVRRESSVFTDTRRGLPLPKFSFGTPVTVKTNYGAKLVIPASLSNVGAPDAFNLSATTSPTIATPGWTWYFDNGANVKTYDPPPLVSGGPAGDTATTNTDGDALSLPDTGLVQPNSTVALLLTRDVTTSDPLTFTVTLTAKSAAQPQATTAVQSFTASVGVDPASCTGCTLVHYTLHNSAVYVSTTTTTPMAMDVNPPKPQTTLLNYSSEVLPAALGRQVGAGGTATESDGTKVGVWYKQVPRSTDLKGTASVKVWARTADGSGAATPMTAYIGSDNNGNQITGFSSAGSGSSTLPAVSDGSWQQVTFSVPIGLLTPFNVNNAKNLVVRVVAAGHPVRLAYDVNTFPAEVVLPVTNGCPC